MNYTVLAVSHSIDVVHFVSCILAIVIIFKTNRLKDHQEQLLALQNLAELFYQSFNIIGSMDSLYSLNMSENVKAVLGVLGSVSLTLSFQILALLAIVLAFSITKALKYKLLVTKKRIYTSLTILLILDFCVGSLSLFPGIRSLEEFAHVEVNVKNISVKSNIVYVSLFCYKIFPPLIVQCLSFYKVSQFALWQTGFISRRVKLYMKRCKLILAVCILLYISYIPHQLIDTLLHFASGHSTLMNTFALVSSFLPAIYNISKFPLFLICYKPYRMTAKTLITCAKTPKRVHPSSVC